MMRWLAALCLCSVLLCSGWARADTERRIALVIGNDAYPLLNANLTNATADARDIGRALEKSGFEVTIRTDVKRRELYQLIDAFGERIAGSPDSVGLFYYAGHGIQSDGKNYLIPVDAELASDADLEAEAVDAGKVLRAMDAARNRFNIVFLDACRNNPLPRGRRSLERGLARMDAPRGTFIGYAAAPGQAALEPEHAGGNGIFTGTLIHEIAQPGRPIEEVFKRTIAGVLERTGGKQVPWMESSLQGNFYFLGPTSVTVSQPPAADAELVFWQTIASSANSADFEEYLRQYPQGRFAGLAHNRIAALRPPAVTAPPLSNSPSSPPPTSPPNQRETARLLKSELQRVGCYAGPLDDNWDRRSIAAMGRFDRLLGVRLDTQSPNAETVAAVKAQSGRVCPLTCPRGQLAGGERCIAPRRPRPGPPARQETASTAPPTAQAPAPSAPASAPKTPSCFTFNHQQICE